MAMSYSKQIPNINDLEERIVQARSSKKDHNDEEEEEEEVEREGEGASISVVRREFVTDQPKLLLREPPVEPCPKKEPLPPSHVHTSHIG